MSVLDLNELVKVFEKKFGVSATAVAVDPGLLALPLQPEKRRVCLMLSSRMLVQTRLR